MPQHGDEEAQLPYTLEAESTKEQNRSRTATSHGTRWILIAVILAVPLTGFLGAVAILRTEFFAKYGESFWAQAAELGYTARDNRCDVLIFGDSTAITGLDPHIIEPLSHLKTCNIAISQDAMILLGHDPLDRFLSNNSRPKYLILQFSVDNLHKDLNRSDMLPLNGLPSLVRFYPAAVVTRTFFRHPDTVLDALQFTYVLTLRNILGNYPNAQPRLNPGEVNSHFSLLQPAFQSCKPADAQVGPRRLPDPSVITGYKERYAASADHVIFDIAPTATCDPLYAQDARALDRVADNPYQQFPISLYNQAYVHFTQTGAERLSRQLAEQILSIQARPAQ